MRFSGPAQICIVMVLAGQQPASSAEDFDFFHFGELEYEISCLPCHGADGKGDGPMANGLAKPPADLTTIMRRNQGGFPDQDLAEMIDGRAQFAEHGPREMPVWGDRYRSADEAANFDVEETARLRIDALVGYIENLQMQ